MLLEHYRSKYTSKYNAAISIKNAGQEHKMKQSLGYDTNVMQDFVKHFKQDAKKNNANSK